MRKSFMILVLVTVIFTAVVFNTNAAIVYKPEKYQMSAPTDCNQSANNFVIDQPATVGTPKNSCGGVSYANGPGWLSTGCITNCAGNTALYITKDSENGKEYVTFQPTITKRGLYEVWVSWKATTNRTADARFSVFALDGLHQFKVNQYYKYPLTDYSVTGPDGEPDCSKTPCYVGAKWAKLGILPFETQTASANPTKGYVKLINFTKQSSDGIDGVAFKYVNP